MNICFFSDEYSSNFKPLILTRPLDDIRIGIFTIREKWLKVLKPSNWIRQVDEYLSQLYPAGSIADTEDYIWINTRFLPSSELINAIQKLKTNQSLIWNGQLIATRISFQECKQLIESGDFPEIENATKINFAPIVLEYFWDLLSNNSEQIAFDIKLLPASFEKSTNIDSSVILKNFEHIYIHESATIEAGCILIADEGPIFIGPSSKLEAGSILKVQWLYVRKQKLKWVGEFLTERLLVQHVKSVAK